ncbi:MAG: hypothetical protein AAFY41_13170 [Bacteroidota bacterium]
MRYWLIVVVLLLSGIIQTQAQDDPYQIALERITEAEETGATILYLSALGLTELPPEIGNLTNLQLLYLYGNQL